MPKVSVIIPAYNAQEYIAETLNSVMAQTYRDFEVIVVDDGSNDQTGSIVKRFEKKYPGKVRLVKKKNGGPASARNMGIKMAGGEFIAFNDADDLWLPKKLEKQVSCFEAQPSQVGLVYTNALKFDKDGIWNLPKKYHKKRVSGWIYKELLERNIIPNQSVMVRKEIFNHVGYFDEAPEIKSKEDYDMWLRIALKYEISYLDEILSLYREHNKGISKNFEVSLKASLAMIKKHLIMAAGNIAFENALNSSLAKLIYMLGYHYLKRGKNIEARRLFAQSLAVKFLRMTYLMKIATFLPFKFLYECNKTVKLIFKPDKITKSKKDFRKLFT